MICLEPGKYYHVYNHANGNENIFVEERNYHFFLKKYKQYISPVAQTLAYSLLPNHFHFAVQVKEDLTVPENDSLVRNKTLPDNQSLPEFQTLEGVPPVESLYVSKQFSRLFNSYTQAFNQSQNRKGSLFYKNFRRKEITSKEYLLKLINYIHFNPVVHGFCKKVSDWKFSSYNTIVSSKETILERDTVIEWFGDRDNFIACHQKPIDLREI